jgi:hypothetical protein
VTTPRKFRLVNQNVKFVMLSVMNNLPVSEENPLIVRIELDKKSRDQEEMYHAIIGDIADQHKVYGRLWDSESMKRLLVDQFWRDTKDDEELKPLWSQVGQVMNVPSLDGSGVVSLGAQTRRFPKKLANAFITWLEVFAAENNVNLERKAA